MYLIRTYTVNKQNDIYSDTFIYDIYRKKDKVYRDLKRLQSRLAGAAAAAGAGARAAEQQAA